MAKLNLVKGTTSYRAYIFAQDSSVSTGAGKTGLVFNTGSLVASYVRPGAARTAITLVTQTVTGAYSSGGFVEIDSTTMPGLYRFDVPDAALATGVNAVVVMLVGAANMAPVVLEIELTATDNQTAVASVNATQLAGQTIIAAAGVTFPASVASPTNITAGTITTVTNLTNAPTAGDLTATMKTSVTTAATAATPIAASVTGAVGSVAVGGITAASFAVNALDAVWSVASRLLTAGTNIVLAKGVGVTGLNDLDAAGVRGAVGLALANLDTQVATLATAANLATVASYVDTEVASILAAVDTEVAAIKAKTDLIPALPAAVADIPTANANADALLDRAAGVETNRTVRQTLRLMLAALGGKLSGAATTTVAIRDTNDLVNRIVATVDADGNRSVVILDAS